MQQSEACAVDVAFSISLNVEQKSPIDSAAAVASFANWLVAHASLVRSITINGTTVLAHPDAATFLSVANTLLSFSIECSVAGAKQPGETVGPEPVHHTAALQLQSYSSNVICSPAVLATFPAATLTKLQLRLHDDDLVHQNLARLSNLKSLKLESNSELPSSFFQDINKLTSLVQLSVEPVRWASNVELLPEQLQRLTAVITGSRMQPMKVDLLHLTKLQELDLSIYCRVTTGARLPIQLQRLSIMSVANPAVSAFTLTALQQLQQLSINSSKDDAMDLLSLAQLPHLHEVFVDYTDSNHAWVASDAWGKLPSLRGLELRFPCSIDDWEAICHSAARCTALEKLSIEYHLELGTDEEEENLPVGMRAHPMCHDFPHLSNLREFSFMMMDSELLLAEDDFLHLTALTGLTKLHLEPPSAQCLEGGLVVALAVELTALQDLVLNGVEDSCKHALPAVARLSGLTRLALNGMSPDSQQYGLQFLTRLRKLKSLQGFESCSQESMEALWAVVQS